MKQRKGSLIIITAPSGCGKTTLIKRLISEYPRLKFSVSYTTRMPRAGEVHGEDYCFVTEEEFILLRDKHFFAEWACVHGSYYGTPLAQINTMLEHGEDVLFDIDIQGALQLKAVFPNALYVFLLPPSFQELEKRLTMRATDDNDTIRRRLSIARTEIEQAEVFNAWIVNNVLDEAYEELRSVYIAHTLAPQYNANFYKELLQNWPK